MERKPLRYGTAQLQGYKAYKAWSSIGEPLYSNEQAAKRACEREAGQALQWEVSVRTPTGNPSWNGAVDLATAKAGQLWQASPHYVKPREAIPGAEFVSPDPLCNYYVVPEEDGRWAVFHMVDLEGRDPFEVMMLTGGSSELEGRDAAVLWNFYELALPDKQSAISYGRYCWGRRLVRGNSPPPAKDGKLRERIRGWAASWL